MTFLEIAQGMKDGSSISIELYAASEGRPATVVIERWDDTGVTEYRDDTLTFEERFTKAISDSVA